MTYPQIARELGLSVSTVTGYARQLLKQQGFRNVAEFRRKLGVGVAVPAGVTR
jgi:DNA-binding NarL/FixJ family response regulator